MQQPDYNTGQYYPYQPNPNPSPQPPPTYASAPPYNYPPTPQFPHIPDPTPTSFPQFTPTPPQPSLDHPVYPPLDPYRPYPQSSPYEPNYAKPDQPRGDYAKPDQPRGDYVVSGSYGVPHQTSPNYAKFDQFGQTHGGYNDGNSAKFDQFGSGYAANPHQAAPLYPQTNPSDSNYIKFDQFGPSVNNSGYGDGVYAYQGSKTEPYGARGTGSWGSSGGSNHRDNGPTFDETGSWGSSGGSNHRDNGPTFDDFGRPIGPGKGSSGPAPVKVIKAVPKAETREDGVQKFRVKLLAESGGQTNMDVLCQIGLDGIRMLDPSTSRTLRIYPLDTVTRFEVLDSSIFAFWAKSPVDIEPRRIRLKSNSYTSSTILDIVTAATIQFKEIGGRSRSADTLKTAEQPTEKRKGLGDWMNMIKPGNEEKDHWVPDEAVAKCTSCGTDFGAFVRRHHCRNCGDIFCDKCTHGRIALTAEENAQAVRVCDRCLAEVTHRLNIAKESSNRSTAGLQSHEDLAKKLQEEMERNRRSSSGSRSDGSNKRMKEVACPTCTVHLQVQVPSSGSETIECGVCQHPFLVSSR